MNTSAPRHRTPRAAVQLALKFASLSLAALLVGCGHKEARQKEARSLPAIAVRTQAAETRKLSATEEVVGTVRAKLRATLEAKVGGRIDQLPVKLGTPVKRGELVARLDAPEVKARLDQAEAGLQQAERDWKRISGLFNQQAVTRSEYDAADARYQVAKAAVAEARAMLAYVEILAPFDGVVTKKWADVGDLALPGKPLVDIEDPAALQLEADVPEAIASKVQPGAVLQLRLDSLADALSGTVTEIAPSADPVSRTLRVKLDLPGQPALMAGRFARLLVPVGESTTLRVPASAVVQRGQMEIVFVVDAQHARLHLVKTGRRFGNETEILSGLDHGDPIVIENASQLVDGQPVEVR